VLKSIPAKLYAHQGVSILKYALEYTNQSPVK